MPTHQREVLKGLEPELKSKLLNPFFPLNFSLSLFLQGETQCKTKGVLQKQFSSFGTSPTKMYTQFSIETYSFSIRNKVSFPVLEALRATNVFQRQLLLFLLKHSEGCVFPWQPEAAG